MILANWRNAPLAMAAERASSEGPRPCLLAVEPSFARPSATVLPSTPAWAEKICQYHVTLVPPLGGGQRFSFPAVLPKFVIKFIKELVAITAVREKWFIVVRHICHCEAYDVCACGYLVAITAVREK